MNFVGFSLFVIFLDLSVTGLGFLGDNFYFDFDKFFSEFVWISQQLLNFVDFFFVFFQKKIVFDFSKKMGFSVNFAGFWRPEGPKRDPQGRKGQWAS